MPLSRSFTCCNPAGVSAIDRKVRKLTMRKPSVDALSMRSQSRTLPAAPMTAVPLHAGRNEAPRPSAPPGYDSATHPSLPEEISAPDPHSRAEALSPRGHSPRALPKAWCAEEERPDRRRWPAGLDSTYRMTPDRTETSRTTRSRDPSEIAHSRNRPHWRTPGWDRVFPRPWTHERQEHSTALLWSRLRCARLPRS